MVPYHRPRLTGFLPSRLRIPLSAMAKLNTLQEYPPGEQAVAKLNDYRRQSANSASVANYKLAAITPGAESGNIHGDAMATEGDVRAAEIAASDARTDTKVAKLEGKIDTAVATLLGEIRAVRDDVRQSDQYNRDTRWV